MLSRSEEKARQLFERQHRPMRTAESLAAGIHPRTLYSLCDRGLLVQLSRGVYCLAEQAEEMTPDLVAAAIRVPRGIVCLISALAFHEITTQVPHEVHLALPKGVKPPRLDFPPVRSFVFGERSYEAGIEIHRAAKVEIKVYSAAKTVADCFKFRNRIGLDVALEALRLCRQRKRTSPAEFIEHARICRVERVMMPYLEALT
ncbi:MAG: type IV toxin-antitoxin system AbiEi family antitoxin domain-containing protein [Armatimonadetes bacterium]|nr:type IV toxin-antitoxin system AbiEi family antitoxin domain-containing protein [Armatimonadota bacterium]